MKKRGVFLLAVIIGLMLTACGGTNEGTKEVPVASQEYVSLDGAYKVILLEGLTQTDVPLQAGSTMMELESESRTGFSAMSLVSYKSNVFGTSNAIESLEDFSDHIIDLVFDGSGMTVSWEDTDFLSAVGAERCLAREGAVRSGLSRGQAYGYFAESADSYFAVIILGNAGDVEEARQVIRLEILERVAVQGGTKDFINGMTAVLDSVNGGSIRETFKMLVDINTDERDLETMASQARQALSQSWGVENCFDLMEMADWLMNEGHNQNALDFLKAYGGYNVADRDAFDAKLKGQNLDEGTYISLLAAYDAWSAYGDGAIAAWDLSRVGTIMGFGYASGYCTYEEAMNKTLEAAKKSQELFDSWEDFNQSYLYGYSYWAEESLDDPQSSAAGRAQLVNSLASQANGPFAVDWNITLAKEW